MESTARMKKTKLLSVTLLPGFVLSGSIDVAVGRGQGCESCSIEVSHIGTVGHPGDSLGIPSMRAKIVGDSEGRYFATSTDHRGEIFVFDGEGRFQRTVGRSGPGPSEFGFIQALAVGDDDQLHVFHDGRYSVATASGEVEQVAQLPGTVNNAVVFSPSTLAVVAYVPTRDAAGFPVHVLSSGVITRSIGADPPRVLASQVQGFDQISRSTGRRVWLHQYNRYHIELWDSHSGLVRTIDRDMPGFEPWEPEQFEPGMHQVGSTREDDEGFLWVTVLTPKGDRVRRRTVEDLRRDPTTTYSTTIDVFAPGSGELLTSHNFDGVIYGFVTDDVVYELRQDRDGVVFADLYRVVSLILCRSV